MKYAESTPSRRVVGQFENGEIFPDVLVDLCRTAGIRAGEVRAHGALSHVDLAIFSVADSRWHSALTSDGAFELLSLTGNISTMGDERVINAKAEVAYSAYGRPHTVGGQLRAATCLGVEFVIDVFDDLTLQRGLNPETQLPFFKTIDRIGPPPEAAPSEPEVRREQALAKPTAAPPAPEPEPTTPPALPPEPATPPAPEPVEAAPVRSVASETEWREAARRTQTFLDEADEPEDPADEDDGADYEEDVDLQPGDTLLHPRLGECTVVRVEEDVAAYIRILKSQRISKLALTVVRLEPVEERKGKRVFRVKAGNQ